MRVTVVVLVCIFVCYTRAFDAESVLSQGMAGGSVVPQGGSTQSGPSSADALNQGMAMNREGNTQGGPLDQALAQGMAPERVANSLNEKGQHVIEADYCSDHGTGNEDLCVGNWILSCRYNKERSRTYCDNGCMETTENIKCVTDGQAFCREHGEGLFCNDDSLVKCDQGEMVATRTCPAGCDWTPPDPPECI